MPSVHSFMLANGTNGLVLWLFDVTLKASLLVLIAALALRVTRGRAAPNLGFSAVSAALLGVLLLPVLAVLMPRLNVPLIPRPSFLSTNLDRATSVAGSTSAPHQINSSVTSASTRMTSMSTVESALEDLNHRARQTLGASSRSELTDAEQSAQQATVVNASTSDATATAKTAINPGNLASIITFGWVCGALVVAMWLVMGLWRLSQWTRCGREMTTADLGYDADWLASRLELRDTPRIIEVERVSSPLTFGWLHPVILLPGSWRTWSRDELRVVLLHEMMHVRRGDWGYLLVARLACIVHWYNPLVWMSARWLEDQRELACDDDVVRCGARPTAYAETLLRMAVRARASAWTMGLSINIAARRRLENRVVSILSAKPHRRGVASLPMIVVLSGVVGGLSVIEPWFAASIDRSERMVKDFSIGRLLPVDNNGATVRNNAGVDLSILIEAWQTRERNHLLAKTSTAVESATLDEDSQFSRSNRTASNKIGAKRSNVMAMQRGDDERVLVWQRSLIEYREIERLVRQSVMKRDFANAQTQAQKAISHVTKLRRFAPTVAAYDKQRKSALDLALFVDDEAARQSESILSDIRAQLERQVVARTARQTQRTKSIGRRLIEHALELHRLDQIEDALVFLDRAKRLMPQYQEIDDLRESLTALYQQRANLPPVRTPGSADPSVLAKANSSTISRLPDSQLTMMDDSTGSQQFGEFVAHRSSDFDERAIRDRLAQVVPEIRFDDTPFKDAIETVRKKGQLNLVVDWVALERAGIDSDKSVSFVLSDISIQQALTTMLNQVGGATTLGFRIDENVVEVSTMAILARSVLTKTYHIADLDISIPNFRGTQIDWSQSSQIGGLGGGRFLEGRSQGDSRPVMRDSDERSQQRHQDDNETASLIDLIRATIEPDTWRSTGGDVGAISAINHQLVVTQTSKTHGQLEDL